MPGIFYEKPFHVKNIFGGFIFWYLRFQFSENLNAGLLKRGK